ncbi:transcription factor Ken-like [Palaemon carinicauda]|uniref:transcription factor Ken-like n=1 Tax=Palaemon carinicauda TaxID=392227 RepID=UPI0035B6946F
MNEEEFLLKWNNHQTNFVDVFNHLLRDDSFVDVTLVCGGEAVLGHKMVLAACSPLLHRILRDNPCKHPVLILSDVPAEDMRAMMKFIYQGEVSVSQSELASFLKTADNLQIKGLAEDKEKDKEHKSKDERKRKDKEDRSEWRSSNKRQRLSDARAAEACSPLLSGSFKTISDSHSSHKSRSKASSDDHSSKSSGVGGIGSLHIPTSKHVSSKTSSSKIVVHGIPNKILNACSTKENCTLQTNSSISMEENSLLKANLSDDLTIKTEPLDYPGEMVWTEGHGAINSDLLDDSQPMMPLGAIPGTLESVAAALTSSPNLPVLETNEDGRCDEESRGDMSTASDDINANTTTGVTWLPGIVVPSSASPANVSHLDVLLPPPPPLQQAPLPPPPLQQALPLPPLHATALPSLAVPQSKEESHDYPVSVEPFSLPPIPSPLVVASSFSLSNSDSLVTVSSGSSSPIATTVTSLNYNNVHKCQQCPFFTSNPYTFQRHLRIHLGTKEFRCRMCAFASTRKDSLIRHFRFKHLTGVMSVYHDLESRDIEELALARGAHEGLSQSS